MTKSLQYYLYFAYGANLNHVGMARRCPDAKYIGHAKLRDYKLTFSGVANIEESPGSVVRGCLWWISAADLRNLDRFEGYPHLYIRRWVRVRDHQRHPRWALVYQMTGAREPCPPAPGYFRTILRGYFDCGLNHHKLVQTIVDLEYALCMGRMAGSAL